MSKKILIIGGVAGGATMAARLRRLDESVQITILERGEYISYANCGLPYYIGDAIKERDALLLQTPEVMKARFNIDVRVNNEAIAIDKKAKTVTVKNVKSGEEYQEGYDTLLIATGSSPLKPPIPGIDGPGIFTLWTVPDTDKIKNFINATNPKRAAIIGGGFIGLEMAENLHAAGCEVTVVEMQNQVMAPIDYEMAQLVHENMRMNNVNLQLSDGVKQFEHKNGVTEIHLQSGKVIEADLVILSIGIRPNSQLAKDAGLTLNAKGGIVVDDFLKTSDPNIYAVGDVIEVEEFISKNKTMIPLAGPANKQARICANNIAREYGLFSGQMEKYNGTQGSSIAKVFDLTVASTGVNEKVLKSWGLVKDKDYFVALIIQKSHAGYYPGATAMTLKMLFNKDGKIFGAQIVGQDGVDKRIDVLAASIRFGGTVHDLTELELAYAPPYSSAKDPVNMLGFVASNILDGRVTISGWDELETLAKEQKDNYTVLDVSEDIERMVSAIPGSTHIPYGQIRKRMGELDKDKLIITYCAIGVRAYNVARILQNCGFKQVKVLPGGMTFYKSVHPEVNVNQGTSFAETTVDEKNHVEGGAELSSGNTIDLTNIVAKERLDCSGLQCPGPIMKVFQRIKDMNEGEILQVSATDMGFVKDISAWCARTGNTLLKSEREGKENIVYIKKGSSTMSLNDSSCNVGTCTGVMPSSNPLMNTNADGSNAVSLPQGKTIIVFSGDLDKVLASFIIANGALAMGRPVSMFFTFWGLNVLRKPEGKVKKPLIDSMFGAMMPKGASKLTLSKMHMGGMGTKMMRKVMHDKNVDSLEALIKQAMDNGVKLIACTMSMDVMGITRDELIDGIEYGGVATMLGDAEQSNVNLFI